MYEADYDKVLKRIVESSATYDDDVYIEYKQLNDAVARVPEHEKKLR